MGGWVGGGGGGFPAEVDRDKLRKTNGKMDGKDGFTDAGVSPSISLPQTVAQGVSQLKKNILFQVLEVGQEW